MWKFEIGKLSHRKCEIQRRHLWAKDLDPEFVQTSGESDSEWIVKSGTDEFTVYYVKLDKKSCDCKLHCDMCGACVHMYTCSCLDATLHYTVCKHVHVVQVKISKNVTEMSTTEENKGKCSHMENHMVTQTSEELLVHYVNRDTKTEDNTASLEQQCSKQFSDHASEDVLIDLEEQDNSVNINEHSVGENNDLQGEDSIDYYSRILKHKKCVDRATLHGEIDTLLIKLNTIQRKCCQHEILNEIEKHVGMHQFCQHNF